MSQIKITQLTSEQESLISVYREKWSRIALSTETINRDCATQAIKSIYSAMAWEKPEVLFFQSLNDAANNLPSLLESRLNEPLSSLEKPLNRQIERVAGNILMSQFNSALDRDNIPNLNSLNNIERQIYEKIWNEIQIKCWYFGLINIWIIYDNEIKKQIRPILKMLFGKKHEGRLERKIFRNLFHSAMETFNHSLIDYFIEVLNFPNSSKIWSFAKQLYENSECFLLYEKIAIVCDRPKTILISNNRYLHAEEKPALEFRDNFKIYAYQGIAIPEKYGKVHSNKWKMEWLSTEKDENVKYALRQGLGINED